jgi:hypothetical protein
MIIFVERETLKSVEDLVQLIQNLKNENQDISVSNLVLDKPQAKRLPLKHKEKK